MPSGSDPFAVELGRTLSSDDHHSEGSFGAGRTAENENGPLRRFTGYRLADQQRHRHDPIEIASFDHAELSSNRRVHDGK